MFNFEIENGSKSIKNVSVEFSARYNYLSSREIIIGYDNNVADEIRTIQRSNGLCV
jgi:ferritin-like protein